jgi:hypothetical protein
MKKQIPTIIGNCQKYIVFILSLSALIGGAFTIIWATVLSPRIDERIDKKIEPLRDVLVRQYFIIESIADSTAIQKANKKYNEYLCGIGKIK